MLDAIVGEKGSGKTAELVKEIAEAAADEENNIVCLEYEKRFEQQIPYRVRLINMQDFAISGYGQLLAFISGVCAQDNDITHLFLDSIYKLAQNEDPSGLPAFIDGLDKLSGSRQIKTVLTISDGRENLPAAVLEHLRA